MKKWWIIPVAAVVGHVCIVCAFFAAGRYYFSLSSSSLGGAKKTPMVGELKDILPEDYDKSALEEAFYCCDLFPENINVGKASMVFCDDPLFRERSYSKRRGQAFLEWSMDEEAFTAEVDRLQTYVRPETKKQPLRSEDLFEYVSFVGEYNDNGGFEYALLDESCFVIRYVRLRDIEKESNALFPQKYLPNKLLWKSDISRYSDQYRSIYQWGCYSIYTG